MIHPNEICGKIEKGEPIECDNVIINGEDLNKLKSGVPCTTIGQNTGRVNLSKDKTHIPFSIKISNSIIEGNLDLNNIIFLDEIDFRNTKFSGIIDFSSSEFNKNALFSGSKFNDANFSNSKFLVNADFSESQSTGHVKFDETSFKGFANFEGSRFVGSVSFSKSRFSEHAHFGNSQFAYAEFINTNFNGRRADFNGVLFNGWVDFTGAKFPKFAYFIESQFRGNAFFDKSEFYGDADFSRAQIEGDVLTFEKAKFHMPKCQEDTCRRAKNTLERAGDREMAGYYFYREMDAKRMQKPLYIRYLEFIFIQKIFGYGVHPFWLIYWWLLTVCTFAFVYAVGNGISGATQWYDYIWFSIVTAIIPGRTSYQPTSEYQVIAGMEAIFGTFMWAAFIATFARKYMR